MNCGKISDRRFIAYLLCVSNARVLTNSIKIYESEGLSDPGILEQPFLPTGVRLFPSAFLIFSRAVFRAATQLTECLEEAIV